LAEAKKWTWERTARTVLHNVEDRIGYIKRRPRVWHSSVVDFSLVVAVRNGVEKFERMVASLPELPGRYEMIVLDDASDTDQAQRIVKACEARERVRYIRSPKQTGLATARARLFGEAKGQYIVSMDADVDFSDTSADWLITLRAIHQRGKGRYGILAPLLLWPNGTVQAAGACADEDSNVGFRLRYTDGPVTDEVCRPAIVAHLSGAVQFFSQALLNTVEMHTAYFPCMFEDADFAYQTRAAGFALRYSPEVTVIHDANTWCQSEEGRRQIRIVEQRALFASRWQDVWEEDLRRQDETGALDYDE